MDRKVKIKRILTKEGNSFGDLKVEFVATDDKVYSGIRFEGEHHELQVGAPLPHDSTYLYPLYPKNFEEEMETFTHYFNSFYGPTGLYPTGKYYSIKELTDAVKEVFKGKMSEFDGDSFCRERIRDHLKLFS